MLRLGVTDMADALHRLPGVTLRDYGGAGGMKTVSVRGFGARHTGVCYDGVMLSEIQGGEIDLSRYSIDNVQTLQLVIGDNDDLFIPARQAASAAVLSIEALGDMPADRRPHLTAQMRVGSYGYASPYLRYVQRVGSGLTLSAIGEYTYAENDYSFKLRNGNLTTHERRTNSRMNSGHGEVGAHWRIGQRHQLWGKLYYYDNDRQLPGIVRLYTNVCGQQERDRNAFAQLRWMGRGHNDRLLFKVNAKYNWASSAYRDTLLVDRRDDATYWQREGYVSGALLYLPDDHWALSYAADYVYNNLNSTLSTDRRPWRHTLLQTVATRYVAGRFTALARLLWTTSINRAHGGPTLRDMRRWSPSFSLSYQLLPDEPLLLRASFKDIFRVPTFNESYFYHYGSTDIQPEKTLQYNVGLTWQHGWGQHIVTRMTADGYINRVHDKIVGVPYNMFIWRTVNMGRVAALGVDYSARATVTLSARQAVGVSAGYSYQRVANHTDRASANYGKQLPYQPLNTLSAAVGWTNPWVNLSLHGTGTSGRWATANHYEGTRMAGYWDMGLTAYHVFSWRGREAELRADVTNVLAHQYELVACYPMPRTQWRLGLKLQL